MTYDYLFLPVLRIMIRFHPSAVSSFLERDSRELSRRSGFSESVFLGSGALGFFLKKREIIWSYKGSKHPLGSVYL